VSVRVRACACDSARIATSHAAQPIVPAVGGFFPTSPATRPLATNQDIKNHHQNTPRTDYRRNHENNQTNTDEIP